MVQVNQTLRAATPGLAAALLFGLSMPLAKLLLPACGPLALAGLLYFGAGFGLFAIDRLARIVSRDRVTREAPLKLHDAPQLTGIAFFGGIAGPLLMLTGLGHLSAVASSLLLNLEAPFTIILAVAIFGEYLGLREAIGGALICVGALVLADAANPANPGSGFRGDVFGVVAIALACLSWAIDNNLTQRLSLRDPIAVTRFKTLTAGATMGVAVIIRGDSLPAPRVAAAAMLLGLFCYGFSLVLHLRAMRALGAARQAALFSTAPFAGAIASVLILHEPLRPSYFVAGLLMAAGVIAILRAQHAHRHTHDFIEHDHAHMHDRHHQHAHPPGVGAVEPHAHPHRHQPMMHTHPHVSDAHHRHGH